MTNSAKIERLVKPAQCECEMVERPAAPCECFHGRGNPGKVRINSTIYTIEILGSLPPAPAEPIVDGYRLTKDNGEAHDICLVAGRLECTCGDWSFRRAVWTDAETADCKHIKAIRQLFHHLPRDQYEPRAEDFGPDFAGLSESDRKIILARAHSEREARAMAANFRALDEQEWDNP